MSKKIKIFRCVVLMLALCFGTSATLAVAATAVEPRTNSYISSFGATITATGGGNIRVSFATTGTDTMDRIGASKIVIYNSDGTAVATLRYTTSTYSNMMGYDTILHTSSVTYAGTSGTSYYAVVTHYAANSTGYGIAGTQTATVTA